MSALVLQMMQPDTFHSAFGSQYENFQPAIGWKSLFKALEDPANAMSKSMLESKL